MAGQPSEPCPIVFSANLSAEVTFPFADYVGTIEDLSGSLENDITLFSEANNSWKMPTMGASVLYGFIKAQPVNNRSTTEGLNHRADGFTDSKIIKILPWPDSVIDFMVAYLLHLGPYHFTNPLVTLRLHQIDSRAQSDTYTAPYSDVMARTHVHLVGALMAIKLVMLHLTVLAYSDFYKALG